MHRVDFYILNTDSSTQRMQFAAKLGEKAFNQGMKTLYWLDQAEEAEAFSQILWTLRPESFLAHEVTQDQPTGTSPICIYYGAHLPSLQEYSYLVNLSRFPPKGISPDRAAEVVIQSPKVLQITRTRYAYFKSVCENVFTHKM